MTLGEHGCLCAQWYRSMHQVVAAQLLADNHKMAYTGEKFSYCPWCGKKLNLEKKDDNKDAPTDRLDKAAEILEKTEAHYTQKFRNDKEKEHLHQSTLGLTVAQSLREVARALRGEE